MLERLTKRVREAKAKLAHVALGIPIVERRIRHHQRQLEVFVTAKDTEGIKRAKNYLRRWRQRRSYLLRLQKHWKAALRFRYTRLVKYRKEHEGTFQPYMVAGRCSNLTDAVKAFIGRAYAAGLYTTSTCDGYPGDGRHSTTSLHYPQNNGDGKGHADDAAGPWDKMVAFQRSEYERGVSEWQELFGPDNSRFVKNGSGYNIAEGDPLENLHDTHVHGAPA